MWDTRDVGSGANSENLTPAPYISRSVSLSPVMFGGQARDLPQSPTSGMSDERSIRMPMAFARLSLPRHRKHF